MIVPIWRESFNPIRQLTLSRILAMETNADRGQHSDIQWMWHHMEVADVTVQASIARRLAFLDGLEWEIKPDPDADQTLAQEQTQHLHQLYAGITNLRDATRALAMGIFTGFQHLDIVPSTQRPGTIDRLDPIPPYYWIGGAGKPWRLNPQMDSYSEGEAVDNGGLVTFEAPPMFRPIARQWFAKTLALSDWSTDLERGSVANIFVVGPPGVTKEDAQRYEDMVRNFKSGGRGYLPNGSDIKQFDPGARSKLPYADRVNYCDQQIVMAATGGLLTMLAAPGTGTLAGGAHAAGLDQLARSDAARLSEAFQRAIDVPSLDNVFPGQPCAAYFSFTPPQQQDVAAVLQAAANLNWAGYRVDQAQLEKISGLKLIPIPPPAG